MASRIRQGPAENYVTIQYGTSGINNRIVLIVPFGKHGIETCNGSTPGQGSSTLYILRQQTEH